MELEIRLVYEARVQVKVRRIAYEDVYGLMGELSKWLYIGLMIMMGEWRLVSGDRGVDYKG